MKNKIELERNIMSITNTIYSDFPELSKYIIEIPVKASGNGEINIISLEDFYQSLKVLLNKYAINHICAVDTESDDMREFPENHPYPPSEDIYIQGKEESEINPEDISKTKTPNEEGRSRNEKAFKDDMSGSDLDVPGSELDDQQERIGSEDEENNYYSLGGDAHNDLDEDNG